MGGLRRAGWRVRCAAALLVLTSGRQDAGAQLWPVERGGYGRRAGAAASADLEAPGVRWSLDLGGGVRGMGWLAALDPDGTPLVLVVRGGRVLAWSLGGALRWATEPLGIGPLLGLLDVDRDGSEELLAASIDRGLYVLSLADGAVRWRIEPSPDSRFGEAWPTDFDGDGVPELYVSDRNCRRRGPCTGRIFSLGSGFPDDVVTLDRGDYTYWLGLGHVGADLDGDGRKELVAFDDDRVVVHDSVDGSERWSLDVDRFPFARGRGSTADLDGDGRDEVVVSVDSAGAPGAKRLFVVELESGALRVRWEDRFDPAEGSHRPLLHPVANLLDRPGPEVVTSAYVPAAGRWETRIYAGDGVDATPLQVIPDRVALAVSSSGGGGRAGLLLAQSIGRFVPALGSVELWRAEDGGSQLVEQMRREGVRPLLGAERWGWPGAGTWFGPDGAGWLAVDEDGDGRAERVRNWAEDTERRFPGGGSFVAATMGVGAEAALLLSTSEGEIEALDGSLRLLREDPARPGHAPLRERVYSAPGLFVVESGDGRWAVLCVEDGAGRLAAYRAPGGTAEAPVRLWWSLRPIERAVLNRPGYGGLPGRPGEVATFERTEGGELSLRLLDVANGGSRARLIVGDAADVPLLQPLWLDAAGRLLVGVVPQTDFEQRYRLVDPVSGAAISSSPLDRVLQGAFDRPAARFDVDADGSLEWVVSQGAALTVLSADGATVLRSVAAPVAGTPAAVDLDGDGDEDLLHGGGRGVAGFDEHLNPMWSFEEGVPHRVPASVQTSGGTRVLVVRRREASTALLDGADGSLVAEASLVAGIRYGSLSEAEAAGEHPAALGTPVAVGDLSGSGQPAFVLGGADGFLYAVSAGDLSLLWALDLKAAVGALAVADFDGDGKAELLAATADGQVHVIDTAELPAPAVVYDTDGTFLARSPAEDRDQLPADRIGANWEPVDGAASYEVQLEREADGLVVVPWTEANGGVRHRFDGLSVPVGDRYVIRVRAVGSARRTVSPPAVSDGFLALEPVGPAPPDAGVDGGMPGDGGVGDAAGLDPDAGAAGGAWDASGGCGCSVRADGAGGTSTVWLVLGVLALLGGRRRR